MIPFLNLKVISALYADELKRAAADVIDSGWYLLGKHNQSLEAELRKYLSASHVITCANGLDALRLILRGYIELGVISTGDEVIVPSNTYIATVLAVTDNRLKPVFVEPNPGTFNLDISEVERAISPRTRAVMPVHLYGRVCFSEDLLALAKHHNLKLIEDNAQAFGASWHGKRTGTLGDAAGFSFYPGKNLGALGDAGAIVTSDEDLSKVVRALGNYGSLRKYYNEYQGLNSRMDELQAAFLRIKLRHIDEENARRRSIAVKYSTEISSSKIDTPAHPADPFEHVWHLYVVQTNDRNRLQEHLTQSGIETLIHYPVPPHMQNAYGDFSSITLPVAEALADRVLSLPLHAALTPDNISKIVEVVNRFE
jgi:dTDP-4-amino-4,6-dideoxygalactose transaminase